MTIWAYDYDDANLLNEFMNACARAGVSGSGLVIGLTGNTDLADAHYLKGVVLSRIDQKKPPFRRSENVRIKGSGAHRVSSVNRINHGTRELTRGAVHEILRIFYEDDGNWSLLLKDDEQFRYPADVFEKTEEKADAETKAYQESFYVEAGYDSGAD